MDKAEPLITPDGRYLVVRGRLWRTSDPSIPQHQRQQLVDELMDARRAVKSAKGDRNEVREARKRVNDAKIALGERGPVWWTDGSADLNRRLVKNTPYAAWYLDWTCTTSSDRGSS